jgi:hypothetical protein
MMDLHRLGREHYAVQITTAPAVGAAAWEASFDEGGTWSPATVDTDADGDWSTWLVAGDAATVGAAVAVIGHDTTPLVRATDTPEVLVRRAPPIRYQR